LFYVIFQQEFVAPLWYPGEVESTYCGRKKNDKGDFKVSRIRRHTPNNNHKRIKDSEDFGGSWNPNTGICFYTTVSNHKQIIKYNQSIF
jgi:hypothetical protein